MIELRPFAKLGAADPRLVKAKHHSHSGSHLRSDNMGTTAPAGVERRRNRTQHRLPAHPHANMDILTYVREGATYPSRTVSETRTHGSGVLQ